MIKEGLDLVLFFLAQVLCRRDICKIDAFDNRIIIRNSIKWNFKNVSFWESKSSKNVVSMGRMENSVGIPEEQIHQECSPLRMHCPFGKQGLVSTDSSSGGRRSLEVTQYMN